MAFCIPKNVSQTLQNAAKRGEINMAELYDMTSEQRRSFFREYTDEATAKGINAGFEQAILSEQQKALDTWVKKTFSIQEKKKAKNVLDKIQKLTEEGALTPENKDSFLQDLVFEKLGATISADEAQEIAKRSQGLEEAANMEKDKFGLPNVEYFKRRHEMDKYLASLTPSNQIKILTSTVGRGNMLLNAKSSIVNVIGNTVQTISQALERRISSNSYRGVVDKALLMEYFNKANSIYSESSYDVTRLESLSDGSKFLGEDIITSEGKGPVRALGRWYEDVVFKQLLSRPDVAFSAYNFADSSNLAATKIAKSEGLSGEALSKRATELFLDSTSIEPKTIEGEAIRSQAIADSLMATFQNESAYSSLALGIRKLFNKASGDLRLGDQIMPFVKTPANVVGFTLDAGGLGAVRAIYNLPSAITLFKQGDPTALRAAMRDMTRTGFGMTAAFLLSSLIDPEDFLGRYPTTQAERELLTLQNARENSIRIGDRWVSLDYFGFLGAPMVGFLYAKKYGEDPYSAMYAYMSGVAFQATNIPGFEAMKDLSDSISTMRPEDGKPIEEIAGEGINGIVDFIRARTIPQIVSDMAKAFDTAEREVGYDKPIDKIKAAIPGLRNTLPEKLDVFGAVIRGEPWYSDILFGARVKTSRDGLLIDELKRLDETGNLPSITRPDKTSSRARELKDQIGEEKFKEAMQDFRDRYSKQTQRLIESPSYKRMSDEDKKKEIDKIKSEELDRMLKRNGYKKPKADNAKPNPLAMQVLDELKGFRLVPQAYAAEDFDFVFTAEGDPEVPTVQDTDVEDKKMVTIPGGGFIAVAKNLVGSVVAAIMRRIGGDKPDTIVFEKEDKKADTDFEKLDSPTEVKQVIDSTPKPKVKEIDQIKATPQPTAKPTPKPKKEKGQVAGASTEMGRSDKFKASYGEGTQDTVNTIVEVAKKYGVRPDLMLDVASQESALGQSIRTGGYHPTQRSASGVFQFTAPTWVEGVKRYGKELGLSPITAETYSDEWVKQIDEGRLDKKINASMAALFIRDKMLSRWDASRHVWGQHYSEEELAPYLPD